MAHAVIMPRQGQSVESCIMTELSKKVGDTVSVGETLFVCETDKASFEVESEVSGTLLAWLCEEEDDVPCLDNVCVIGEAGEDISEFLKADDSSDEAESKQEVSSQVEVSDKQQEETFVATVNKDDRIKISPRAKNTAINQSLDLTRAVATGPEGRIIERDVLNLAKIGAKLTSAASSGYTGGAVGTGLGGAVTTSDLANISANQGSVQKPIAAEYEDVKLSNVRKFIAKAMHASLSEMAQLTLNSSFDATSLMEFRSKVKNEGEASGLNNITLNDMILYAVSKTLQNHRECNAHYLDDKMRLFQSVNIGIAVDTPRGLLVPTVFGSNNMSLNELSKAAKGVITSSIDGSIAPDMLTGGTFTVTNLGALGIESFTPVINPPQTCILGVGSICEKVRTVNGQITTYKSMGLSLTHDHRALDGAPAAKFLKELVSALENFSLLLAK